MKGKLLAFASILCIASLMASGANAGKPDKPPGKPGETQTELIEFKAFPSPPEFLTNFIGSQPVEGCCPNAGPFPQYTLTLTMDLVGIDGTYYLAGVYDGYVFMNAYREGKNRLYQVQFWTDELSEPDLVDQLCIEMYGGVRDYNKKTKVLTVTFENVAWHHLHERDNPLGFVSFVLTRSPI